MGWGHVAMDLATSRLTTHGEPSASARLATTRRDPRTLFTRGFRAADAVALGNPFPLLR